MKKFFALLLAAMMALSIVSAFAEEQPATPGLIDEEEFVIPKVYFLKNSNTDSPEVTFTFEVEKVSVENSDFYNFTNMPEITGGPFTVTFADTVAVSTSGVKLAPAFPLPTYEAPGVFTYKITEVPSTVAGVELHRYDESGNMEIAGADKGYLNLVVTVARGDDGLCRVVHIHYENDEENSQKIDAPSDNTEGILNVYSAGQLVVSKTVTGNMGDRTKKFEVTVTLKAPAGREVLSAITYGVQDGDETIADADKTIINGFTGETTFTVELAHGQNLVIDNIPYGVTYSVKEADYTGENGGYDAPVYTNNGTATSSSGNAPVANSAMDSATENVEITNNKGMLIPTGVILDTLPYVILLGVVIAGAVFMMMKKRSSREE